MKHAFDRADYEARKAERAAEKAGLRALREDVEKLKKAKP